MSHAPKFAACLAAIAQARANRAGLKSFTRCGSILGGCSGRVQSPGISSKSRPPKSSNIWRLRRSIRSRGIIRRVGFRPISDISTARNLNSNHTRLDSNRLPGSRVKVCGLTKTRRSPETRGNKSLLSVYSGRLTVAANSG